MQPWGQIGIGIGEMIALMLPFDCGFYWLGALTGMGLISGALFYTPLF